MLTIVGGQPPAKIGHRRHNKKILVRESFLLYVFLTNKEADDHIRLINTDVSKGKYKLYSAGD